MSLGLQTFFTYTTHKLFLDCICEIIFAGTPEFAATALAALLKTSMKLSRFILSQIVNRVVDKINAIPCETACT